MAHIDSLVDKIADLDLRKSLRQQVDLLLQRRSFGLVFQEHKPEVVELPNYAVRTGCSVFPIAPELEGTWLVSGIANGQATITKGSETATVSVQDVVVVREFGEAIYPGLFSVGKVLRAPDKPTHAILNGENYHALETLLYAYEGKVDAIYIDPPYNTGAKDWKYNNDYVDDIDDYRHSKWLAFIDRRLWLAKRLMNPADSVLVITIDENEVHHLGVLLEQIFPEAVRQMVTIAINGKGVAKSGQLSRVEEYAFFVFMGAAQAASVEDNLFNDAQEAAAESPESAPVETEPAPTQDSWASLLRRGTDAARRDRFDMFYPFYVDPTTKRIVQVGDSLARDAARDSVTVPPGLVAVWPIRTDNSEGRWQVGRTSAEVLLADGFLKLGALNVRRSQWAIKYVPKGQRDRIAAGDLEVVGRGADGSVLLVERAARVAAAKTIWNRARHNAGTHGSGLLRNLIPGRSFPFPKSLYAVVDTLRVMVGDKKEALVLDFFGGSGTTAHAVAYLNASDGGRRRSIVVTNNEVSVEEARQLRLAGLRPGADEWEKLGIFEFITKPRLEAAVTGRTIADEPVKGNYLNGAAIADGFDENVEFFNLTYEDPDLISMGRKFSSIAPLLWLRAGARGARIDEVADTWTVSEQGNYAVLFDEAKWRDFAEAVAADGRVEFVYVVTDSRSVFQQIASELPPSVDATQLYEDYLRTFRINTEVVK